MEKWTVLYDKTLEVDIDQIVIPDFKGTEVEVYMMVYNKYDANDNLYLTSESSGNIYGEPRVCYNVGTTPGVLRMIMRRTADTIWTVGTTWNNYFKTYYPSGNNEGFHADKTLVKSNFNGLTLKFQQGSKFLTGNRIFIRGR